MSCGECAWCRRGRTNLCARYYTLGLSTHGGLAQYVAAPVGTLREIPAGCPDLEAALAQPLAVGLHAVNRAGIQPGDHVALLGAGAIGSFILAGLAEHGGPVTPSTSTPTGWRSPRPLALDVPSFIGRDVDSTTLRDLVPAGADVVIESSGVPGSAERAFALAARGGTVLLVGLTKTPQPLALADVVLREVDVKTTVAHVCATDLPAALALLTTRPLASTPRWSRGRRPGGRRCGWAGAPMAEGSVHGKVLVSLDHG